MNPTFDGTKGKLPIKFDEESSRVDKRFEISNLELVRDIDSLIKMKEILE